MKKTVWLTALWLFSCTAMAATDIAQLRQSFLRAEKLIAPGREAEYVPLAQTLKDYPLYPYLQYQWLKNHLTLDDAVIYFLNEYGNTRYAPLLRDKWLDSLAKKGQWPLILRYYRPGKNTATQCQYHLAQYYSGQQTPALTAARSLWQSGQAQPDSCETLFTLLQHSSLFNRDVLWQRFRAGLENDNLTVANAVVALMNPDDKALAASWLRVHQQPEQVQDFIPFASQHPQGGLIVAHGLNRLAEQQPGIAAMLWDSHKNALAVDSATANALEQHLGLHLSLNHDKSGYQRLAALQTDDETIREWRVRAALLEQNWLHVRQALSQLSAEQQQQDKWRYWLARALQQTGQQPQAQSLFAQVSRERSFYGFLAADYLQQPIDLRHRPVPVAAQQIQALRQLPALQMVEEFIAVDKDNEAKAQWWFVLEQLDDNGKMAAAKLAQQWDWRSTAIFTLAKARYWDDMELRFPLLYLDTIKAEADRQQLDPSLVLGLIRQETAFEPAAQSPVGAKGLMQLMPKTAQTLAQALQQPWRGDSSLLNPALNIAYGTAYYKQLLTQFRGHYALAAAAYNAGSHKVKRWLPTAETVPGDIWLETIPYKETRAYVASVLGYALIYQQRLYGRTVRASELLPAVGFSG